MNLIFGLICLCGAVAMLAYDFVTGQVRFPMLGLNVSSGWFLLLLALYNVARWYSHQASVREAAAMRYVDEARLRQAQRRERADPDPTFDFSDSPKPPAAPPTAGGEPSNN